MGKEGKIEEGTIGKEGLQKKFSDDLDEQLSKLKGHEKTHGTMASAHLRICFLIMGAFDEAKEKNIPESEIAKGIDKKKIQRAYEIMLGGERVEPEDVDEFSKRLDIPVHLTEGVNNIEEEAYIRFVHNPYMDHADIKRKELIEKAEEKGVDIDYNKVVKMEFRDFLKIPKEKWLDQEKEVKVDDKQIKVEAHGFFEENEDNIEGKFIMAKDPEKDKQKIIFDSTMGEHKDIGAKYDVEPIGGGWMTMNPKEKTIVLSRESENFGKEPRRKTIQALTEVYPDWKIEEEKKEE